MFICDENREREIQFHVPQQSPMINMQTLYSLCRDAICRGSCHYSAALENIHVVRAWVNTIDSLDISLIYSDTVKFIEEIHLKSDVSVYLAAIAQVTVILNNIFYSSSRPYRKFWIECAGYLYTELVMPVINFCRAGSLIKTQSVVMDVNVFYSRFFHGFKDACIRNDISVDLEEYVL